MVYNSTIHIDEWTDPENQVHKLYEPVYPGISTIFTGRGQEEVQKPEDMKADKSFDLLPF